MPDPSQPMPPGSAVPLPTSLTPESMRDYMDARMREHKEWERQQYGYQNGYSPHQPNPYQQHQGFRPETYMAEPWQFDQIYRLLNRIVEHIEREESGGMHSGNPYPRHYSQEEIRRGHDKQGRPLQLSFKR